MFRQPFSLDKRIKENFNTPYAGNSSLNDEEVDNIDFYCAEIERVNQKTIISMQCDSNSLGDGCIL